MSRRLARALTTVLAGLLAGLLAGTLAPPDANALSVASRDAAAFQVVQHALAQAAKARAPEPVSGEEAGRVDGTADADQLARAPLATAEVLRSSGGTIEATDPGVTAEFSGFRMKKDLKVELTELDAHSQAAVVAQTGGTVLGAAVDISATDGDGEEVTSFPAKVTTEEDAHGVESVTEVDPGVELGFDVDPVELKRQNIDPASLAIYTRENEGDEWVRLPSYYDDASAQVKGESDHLSDFVVIGVKFEPPNGPRIVLDPDDDFGWAEKPSPASELNYNVALANQAAAKLAQVCLAEVVVTRQADVRFVSGETRRRIAAAHRPKMTVTVAFDALVGTAWGVKSNGGTYVYTRGGAGNALQNSLVKTMPKYTGRPAHTRAANHIFPNPAFNSLPGAKVHMETLYLDHNYDRPVIDHGFGSIVNGLTVSLAKYAETLGFDCSDPARGGLPAPPSKAQLAKWRKLGHQNYQTYGADPISFSTGNLVEDEPLFSVSGVGSQAMDFGLVYNSQDGRLSRLGAGWSFELGGRAQRFDDGSVLVVRGDGASFVFEADGSGGFTTDPGLGLTLSEAGKGILKLRSDAGEVWRYDAADIEGIGELISHTDRNGNTITLKYGAAKDTQKFVPLTSVTDEAGQKVTVQNDSAGRITGLVHPDGRRWRLAYDSKGNLAKITEPGGAVRSYAYDSKHRLLSATDALGVTYLSNSYDAQGRVIEQLDAEGNVRTLSYGDGETRYVDNEGEETVYTWDEKARITGIHDAAGGVAAFEFDDEDRVTRATEPGGRVTSYAYDERGNVTREVRPDGGEWLFTWSETSELLSETDPMGRTTTHTVNAQGLRTQTVQADGSVVSYAYTDGGDLAQITYPSGAVESFGYDDRGNLTERVSPEGRTTTYGYDEANRLIFESDGAGVTWRFAYDAADNLVKKTDGLGHVAEYTYDRNGHLLTETAADGGVTRYVWDDMFRLARVTDPEGGVTEYRYNREDALVGMTDPIGAQTEYEVDPLARVQQVTDPLGGTWDAEIDAAGRVTETTDPLGRVTRTEYDALGRVVAQTDPEGGVTRTAYDAVGNVTSVTDPEGGVTEYRYDAADRLTDTVDPDGRVESYHYDADGGLVAVEGPVGEAVGFVLDADGLVASATDPLGGVTRYEYDGAGRVTAVIDPMGARTKYGYDDAGRQVSVTDALGATSRTEYDEVGRVTATVDAEGHRTETRYDLAGRVVSSVDGEGGVTRYSYDAAGRQVSTRDAEGRVTAYEYDDAGQLLSVVEGSDPGAAASADLNVRTAYTYTAAGELATITDPLGGVMTHEYDLNGRVTRTTDAAGAVTSTSYDLNGRVVTEVNGAGQSLTSRYTAGGLLTEVTGPGGTASFEYDGAGRPVVMRDPTGVTAWEYDALGRTLSETTGAGTRTEVSYDAVGRVVSLALPDATVGYGYDAVGRMVSQQTPWGDLDYVWSVAGVLTDIQRSDGVHTSIVSDAAGRVTEMMHAEPLPVLAGAEVEAAASTAPLPKQAAQSCPVDGVGGYLDRRELQNLEGEVYECVKTGAYLARRTQPGVTDPIIDGGALSYTYGYNAAGQVTSSQRDILELPQVSAVDTPDDDEAPEPLTAADRVVTASQLSEYRYDGLGRLSGSTVTDPVAIADPLAGNTLAESTFGYDAAGNRTLAEIESGEETRRVQQEFGPTGRIVTATTSTLTSTPTGEETLESESVTQYGYDGAGRRVSVAGGPDADAQFSYDWGGQPTRVEAGGIATETAYDGLGRAVTQEIAGPYGEDRVTQSFLGGTTVARSSAQHGDMTLVWGALGELAGIADSGEDPEARWALLDRLGSVVAEGTGAAGADISELVSYGEYGVPGFESAGFSQLHGFTGELQDGGTGMVSFGSRAYDPQVGAWLAPDVWPGLMTVPQSLNRYGYVLGDPVTLMDVGGFKPAAPGYTGSRKWVRETTQRARAADFVNRFVYKGGAKRGSPLSRPPVSPRVMSVVPARHATATRQCAAGDWDCRVRQVEPDVHCTVFAVHCELRTGIGEYYSYSYQYDWKVSNGSRTPEEVMRVFQQHPTEIFPFEIQGCRTFYTGAECHLIDAAKGKHPLDDGWVGVTTDARSVKFTVTRKGYFDAPGSTIVFSTWADENGDVYLRQTAKGFGTDVAAILGVYGLEKAKETWSEQKDALIKQLLRTT